MIEIVAGTWNEIYHRLFVLEPQIAPAHALLVVGMVIVNLGAILGLSVLLRISRENPADYTGMMKQIILVSLLASFAAIWLISAGSTMYVAGVYRTIGGFFGGALGLAWTAPLVLIPAMRTVDRFGTATFIGLIYQLVNLLTLVVFLGEQPYVPLGILSAFAFDLTYFGVKKFATPRFAALLVGLLSGPFLLLTYYPFTPSMLGIHWTDSLRFTLAASTVAGLVGGITGYAVVDRTRSLILKVASRRS